MRKSDGSELYVGDDEMPMDGYWIISYCSRQDNFHMEHENEFWQRTYEVFYRDSFKTTSYVPILRVRGYDAAQRESRRLIYMLERHEREYA